MTTGRILLAVVAVCTAASPVGCSPQADDPSLIQREDSAGVEIVEALRPLWGESSLWRIDPEPTVDLTVSGSGPNHQFGSVRAGGMVRLADGSLVVADATYRQIRLYSPEGGFLASAGRAGEGPGEFSGGIVEMVGATGDTVWVPGQGRSRVGVRARPRARPNLRPAVFSNPDMSMNGPREEPEGAAGRITLRGSAPWRRAERAPCGPAGFPGRPPGRWRHVLRRRVARR